MEEDGDGEDLTPFWLQSNTNLRRGDRLRRGASSLFFSSGLLLFLLLVTAVFLLAVVVPSTTSFSAQIFRPNSVKKSWDSLNVVLVLVAVVFGFLSRNKNEERYSYHDEFQASSSIQTESQKSNPSTPNKWYEYPTNGGQKSNLSTTRQWYEHPEIQARLERKNSILRRNSSSYPDLREFSSANWSYRDYQRRFYDDFHVDPVKVSDPGQLHRRHRSFEAVDNLRAGTQTKTAIVDTLVTKSKEAGNSPPPSKPAHPPTPREGTPLGVEENMKKGGNESAAPRKERSRGKMKKDLESMEPMRTPPPPPPPPPQPQKKSSKSDRKRGGATGSATKDFWNSLSHKKKKKQRQKSVDNLDSLLHEAQAPLSFQLPLQSPPPPSPPPSALQNLFSYKKQKRKRTIKVMLAPQTTSPPPPQPEPEPQPKSQTAQLTTRQPPKPIKMRSFEKLEETSNSGGESPLNRIPPPPPPPPPAFLKSPAWKFVVQGDYVRVNSNNSSRSGSPDPDEVDSDVTPSATDGGHITPFHPSPLHCSSPDVNTEAESFITSFRAKLKLEKIHSMKKRELGLSSLGPRSGPSKI